MNERPACEDGPMGNRGVRVEFLGAFCVIARWKGSGVGVPLSLRWPQLKTESLRITAVTAIRTTAMGWLKDIDISRTG